MWGLVFLLFMALCSRFKSICCFMLYTFIFSYKHHDFLSYSKWCLEKSDFFTVKSLSTMVLIKNVLFPLLLVLYAWNLNKPSLKMWTLSLVVRIPMILIENGPYHSVSLRIMILEKMSVLEYTHFLWAPWCLTIYSKKVDFPKHHGN